jgi:hypothetical protein
MTNNAVSTEIPPDPQIRRALFYAEGDVAKAAEIMAGWMVGDGELRAQVLPALVAAYIQANAERFAQSTATESAQ